MSGRGVALVALACAYGVVIALYRRAKDYIDPDFKKAADALGLTASSGGAWGIQTLEGTIDGFSVGCFNDQGGGVRVKSEKVPSTLGLYRGWQAREAAVAAQLKTGDWAFDADVCLCGDASAAFALMDARTREVVRKALKAGAFVDKGAVCIPFAAHQVGSVEERVKSAVELARHLTLEGGEGGTATRLARSALEDPNKEVRSTYARVLLEHFPKEDCAQEVARAALSSGDLPTRLLGATVLRGTPGRVALEQLFADSALAMELRAQALEALLGAHPWSETGHVALAAIRSPHALFRGIACRAAGRERDTDFLPALVEAAGTQACAEDAARAMGELGDARAEPALENLVAHASPAIRAAAGDALQKIRGGGG